MNHMLPPGYKFKPYREPEQRKKKKVMSDVESEESCASFESTLNIDNNLMAEDISRTAR